MFFPVPLTAFHGSNALNRKRQTQRQTKQTPTTRKDVRGSPATSRLAPTAVPLSPTTHNIKTEISNMRSPPAAASRPPSTSSLVQPPQRRRRGFWRSPHPRADPGYKPHPPINLWPCAITSINSLSSTVSASSSIEIHSQLKQNFTRELYVQSSSSSQHTTRIEDRNSGDDGEEKRKFHRNRSITGC